jgi:hypothetical protein
MEGTFLTMCNHCSPEADGKVVKKAGKSEDLPEKRMVSPRGPGSIVISWIKLGCPRIDNESVRGFFLPEPGCTMVAELNKPAYFTSRDSRRFKKQGVWLYMNMPETLRHRRCGGIGLPPAIILLAVFSAVVRKTLCKLSFCLKQRKNTRRTAI